MTKQEMILSLYSAYEAANMADADNYKGDLPSSAAHAVCNPLSKALIALGVDMDKTCGCGELVMAEDVKNEADMDSLVNSVMWASVELGAAMIRSSRFKRLTILAKLESFMLPEDYSAIVSYLLINSKAPSL